MVKKRQLDAKRIVVKVGTSTLIHPNGKVNFHAIDQLCYVLTGLVNDGKQVVLVSSGAIGVGMGQVGLHERPESIPAQQALAAIGQSGLINYDPFCIKLAFFDHIFSSTIKLLTSSILYFTLTVFFELLSLLILLLI